MEGQDGRGIDRGKRDELLRLLDRLERSKAEVGRLIGLTDGDNRLAVVRLRREIAQQLFDVGAAGEALFAQSPQLATFRVKLARVRSTTRLHQAEWPAVMLGQRRDDFLKSVEPLREASAEFGRWLREALGRLD